MPAVGSTRFNWASPGFPAEQVVLVFVAPDGRGAPAGDDFLQFPFPFAGGGMTEQGGLPESRR